MKIWIVVSLILISIPAFAKEKKKKPQKLSPYENALVHHGLEQFKRIEMLPPPSQHMADKMQSQVPPR